MGDIRIGKEEMELSLFANDKITCMENLIKLTIKLLELRGAYQVAGYKINSQS